jgi:uncharacterized membrane protein YqhA
LYIGLIVAQGVYVFHFLVELLHLVEAVFGSQTALQALVNSIGYKTDVAITSLNETVIMLVVLALIDVVMISNLLIMVIVGGYETFVAKLGLDSHPDRPDWLSHTNENTMKIKLSLALIGISSLGSHEFKARDTVLLSLGLCVMVVMVFIKGLGLTIPVWPVFMRD